jgi:hypothetical protein
MKLPKMIFRNYKMLHENQQEGCTAVAMDKATGNGRLYIVQWLHENRTEGCTVEAMDGAVVNGHLLACCSKR